MIKNFNPIVVRTYWLQSLDKTSLGPRNQKNKITQKDSMTGRNLSLKKGFFFFMVIKLWIPV